MQNTLKYILLVTLVFILIAICSVVIHDASQILSDLGSHIMNLFKNADLHPERSGFNEFIQLILIAVFVGWAIRRLKR